MKKKYIIALEDRNVWSCGVPAKTLLLSDVSIFGTDLASVNTGIELTPYTEPDTEKVMEEAYKNGYDAACKDIDIKSRTNAAYRKGLEDAWDCARKISSMDSKTRDEIFDRVITSNIVDENTASEAIEKIRQYEQERQFHVGDEIETQNGFKGFVISADDKYVYFVNENGEGCVETMMAAKTGRHFPEIAVILQKMKER